MVRSVAAAEAESARQPFANLRELAVHGFSPAILLLLRFVRASAVERLYLLFFDTESVALAEVAAFARLKKLHIDMQGVRRLQLEHILPLGRLTALGALEVNVQGSVNEYKGFCDMGDEDIMSLVSGLRELRLLSLIVRTPLSLAALRGVGTRCRLMHDLNLSGAFALDEWPTSGEPLLSNLRNLMLNRFGPRAQSYVSGQINALASRAVSVLLYHAPMLELLELGRRGYSDSDVLDNAVQSLWYERRGT